jgi:pyrroloquinoline quinone biosynthesis protein D
MTSITLDDKPLKNDACRMEELDDEILLYHPGNNKTLYINKSASIIWQLCTGEQTVADIIALIKDAYPAQPEDLEQDVIATLTELKDNDAVMMH